MNTFNYYNNLTLTEVLENWLQVASLSDFITNDNLFCEVVNGELCLIYTDKLISVSEKIPYIYATDENLDIWENIEILRKIHKLAMIEYNEYINNFIE